MLAVDSNFLKVLSYQFIQGDRSALDGPNRIVITESLARKIFGDTEPMGQTLLYNNNFLIEVMGVIKDPEHRSHLKADALISWDTFYRNDSWNNLNAYTYILLHDGTGIEEVRKKILPSSSTRT